jgi:hypothetical protein
LREETRFGVNTVNQLKQSIVEEAYSRSQLCERGEKTTKFILETLADMGCDLSKLKEGVEEASEIQMSKFSQRPLEEVPVISNAPEKQISTLSDARAEKSKENQGKKSGELCRNFVKDSCKWGKRCRYSRDPAKVELVKKYLNGVQVSESYEEER